MDSGWQEIKWGFLRLFIEGEELEKASQEAKIQALLDTVFFLANLTLSLAGAILVGIIAYLFIHRNQQENLALTSTKDRLEVLHELEDSILALHARPSILVPDSSEGAAENGLFELRSALDDREWGLPEPRGAAPPEFCNGRRMWVIRPDDGARIDSQALHESLVWFRRLDRGIDAKLVHGEDLFRLWRQILPFIIQGRYSYLKRYFSQEVQSIGNVAKRLVSHCQSSDDAAKRAPLDFLFNESPSQGSRERRIDQEFLQDYKVEVKEFKPSQRRFRRFLFPHKPLS
jgi:hypothetical protein